MRKIREIRKQKGFSLKSLSRESGVAESTILDFEKGKIKNLNNKKLEKLAATLECSIEELKKEISNESEFKLKLECKNQICLLNKNCMCTSPIVLAGKAPCYGKNRNNKG